MGHSHLSAAVTHSWQASPGAAPGRRPPLARMAADRSPASSQRSPLHVSPRTWVVLGAVFAALAVGLGAFGAHGLKERLDLAGRTDVYETAVRYHMYHALALVCVGLCATQFPSSWLNAAGGCFTLGIAIFSGLLYAYALGGPRILGAIVPIGGTAFILGWLAVAVAALTIVKK